MIRRATWLAAAGVLALACCCSQGCSRDEAASPGPLRLLDLPASSWSVAPVAQGAELERSAVEICGDVVPCFRLAAGATAACTLDLPARPAWLDLEVASIGDGNRPPPPAELEVALEVAGRRRLLYRGIPRAGRHPSAFGFASTRIELVEELGERATLSFTLAPAQPPAEGLKVVAMALGNPRIAPRVSAAELPWCVVLFRAEGPGIDEPAIARIAPLFGKAPAAIWERTAPRDDGVVTGRARTFRESGGEAVQFAGVAYRGPNGGATVQPTFDRMSLFDPYAFDSELPGFAERVGWGVAILAERARELGEHRLFLELARPRTAPLFAAVTASASGPQADAAFLRLVTHLKANDLLDRTLLCFLSRAGAAAIRVPPGWRERTHAPPPRAFTELAEAVEGAGSLEEALERWFPDPAAASH